MLARLERASGTAQVSFKLRGEKTVLADLVQKGCGKVRLCRREPDLPLEAVVINTTGGFTDGDKFSTTVNWDAGTCAVVTTQAAERFYKTIDGKAALTSTLNIAEGACGVWLPQETIMFDGAAYDKNTIIQLHGNAHMVAIESSVFGRLAMKEIVKSGSVKETWQVRHNDRLIFADSFALDGNIDAHLAKPTVCNSGRAISTILCTGGQPADLRDAALAGIAETNGLGGATCLGPLVVIRIFAKTSYELRGLIKVILAKIIKMVTAGHSVKALLPRVWAM